MHLTESAHKTNSTAYLLKHSQLSPPRTFRAVAVSEAQDSHKDAFRRYRLASHRKAVAFLCSVGPTAFIDS